MNLTKQLGLSLVIGSGLLFGLSTTQTTAHASTYLRYYENIPNKTVSVTNKNAYVYNNGRLSRKVGTMRYYGSKVEEYYAAHVAKNGKASIYYKFRVGHRTGWVWHGYLKSIASSTGTTPANTGSTSNTGTTTNSGATSTDLAPVENINWSQTYAGISDYHADETLMKMFPNTVYSKYLHLTAMDSFDTTDGVDGTFYFNNDLNNSIDKHFGLSTSVKPVVISAQTSEPEPFTKANIDAALTKAGYNASKRAQYSGWYIGGHILPADRADEGLNPGDTTVILLPTK